MKRKITLCLVSLAFLLILSCKKEEVDTFDCGATVATYTVNVKPILDANCATGGCHDAGSAKSGVNLSNYSESKKHAGHNHFLGSIQHKKGYEAMPKNKDKLADAEIKILSCWVQNGTPE